MHTRCHAVWIVIGALLVVAGPVWAHHSLQAQFDVNKPVRLTGTISKIEWVNPHAYVWLDVKDNTGKVTTWGLELAGQTQLRKAGATRILKVGQTYTADALLSRNGKAMAFLKTITMSDGRQVTFWFGDPNAR